MVTGVLLVGGASRRFGSPKALAELGGETLAARAWRALGWCDERLAVGKAADRLPVPFPLLDDGAEERAPIFGVAAGLRAARHDVCLFLPVDCPLVDERLLRRLADTVAVPESGPLPGAYPRAALPAVEARIAAGDYSLRGLNSNRVPGDAALLADVDTVADLARLAGAGVSAPAPRAGA